MKGEGKAAQLALLDSNLSNMFSDNTVTNFDIAILMEWTTGKLHEDISDKNMIDQMDGVRDIIDDQFADATWFFYCFILFYVMLGVLPFICQCFLSDAG